MDGRIFRLKNSPSGPMEPWEAYTTTWYLTKDDDDYELEVVCRLGALRKSRKIVIGPRRAQGWIKALESVKVPIFLNGYDSCDGSYFELTTGDMYASLTLTWLNVPPEGAEELRKLEEALWAYVTPDLDFGVDGKLSLTDFETEE